ncbi:glycosyltransferase family 4 protein [Patescibacteria group bacterium]|nr:glycosyltransferase family 4 protein [Patescibacteria group bacterium]MBU1896121.1 glycosyltransferase family 4 protein [Patescibacteria group bacterium]
MEKKKVLFVYRYSALKNIISGDGQVSGPTEFLWGMNFLDKEKFEIRWVNAPRTEKRTGIRKLTWFLEFPFGKFIKIGLPIEIPYLFKKEIEWADEIICVNDPISLGILFSRFFGKFKKKKIYCIIMSLQERIKYFNWFKPAVWFVSKLLNKADSLIILSDFVRGDFVYDYKIIREKVKTMYFGIDINFWKHDPEVKSEDFILSIGNDMNRDFQTLVRALPENIKLKIITKKNVDIKDKSIEILSGISDEDLRELYNKSLFVVVPSIKLKNESSGLSSALQGMACGRPVILSDAPPMRELFIDNEDCLFYEPENDKDLANKMKSLLENEALREKIAKSGYKKTVENYTCKNMGKRLEYILLND